MLDGLAVDSLLGLWISEQYNGDGVTLFRHACALNLEGIVSKLKTSPYRSGRLDGWRKTKCSEYRRRDDTAHKGVP